VQTVCYRKPTAAYKYTYLDKIAELVGLT